MNVPYGDSRTGVELISPTIATDTRWSTQCLPHRMNGGSHTLCLRQRVIYSSVRKSDQLDGNPHSSPQKSRTEDTQTRMDVDSQSSGRMSNRRWLVFMLCLVWAGSIFATSSTVILPQELFAWFRANIFDDPESLRKLQLFWGASWLFIVKGWHVTEFAILMVLSTLSIDAFTNRRTITNLWIAAGICAMYAASDEWHQTFVPRRGGIVSDVFIDCGGVAIAGILLCRRRKSPSHPVA